MTLHDVEVAMKENEPAMAIALFQTVQPIIADLRSLLYSGQQTKAGLDQAQALSNIDDIDILQDTALSEPCSEPLDHLQSNSHGSILISQPHGIKAPLVPWGRTAAPVNTTLEQSMALSRALNELRHVSLLLDKWSTFWGGFDDIVQKVSHMKDHTETIVNFA